LHLKLSATIYSVQTKSSYLNSVPMKINYNEINQLTWPSQLGLQMMYIQAVYKKSMGGGKRKSEKIIMNEKPDPVAKFDTY